MTWGFPKIRGTLLGGPNNEDCNILGSTLGLKIVMARRKATREIHSSALHRSKEEVPGSQHT